jgi:trimeric autotransporter adhesin
MRRNSSQFTLAAASLVCILILAACNCAPTLRYLTITPASATISVGTSQQFTAQAYYSDGSVKDGTSLVTWSSTNTAVATVVGGVATGVGPGTTTITATAAGTPGATATLNVNQLLSIAVTPANQNVPVGGQQQYDAMGTYKNPDGTTGTTDVTTLVTWSAAPASVATITTGGLATAVGSGTATITASLNGVNGSTSMITGPPVPVSLTISPSAPTIAVGNSDAFTATENWSDGTTGHPLSGTVTWTSGTPATASILATSGLAVGLTAGTTQITASETVSGNTISGNTTLTVVTGTTHFAYVSNNAGTTPPPAIQWYSVSTTTSPYLTSQGTVAPATPPVQTVIHPSGKYLYATDDGGNVWLYNINTSTGALTLSAAGTQPQPTNSTPGTTFTVIDPYGRFLYMSNDTTGAIYGFTISQTDGTLTAITMTPSPFTTNLNTPECLIIDRTGTYLYASNYGNNTISAYTIDQTSGALATLAAQPTIATGSGPLYGTLDPTGTYLYVANTGANSVSQFTIGTGSSAGVLSSIGADFVLPSTAVLVINVVVDPSGAHIYVLDEGGSTTTPNGQVFGFNIGSGGVISSTAIAGTPVTAGNTPTDAILIDPTGALIAVNNNFDNDISLYLVGSGGTPAPTVPPTVATGDAPLHLTFYNAP